MKLPSVRPVTPSQKIVSEKDAKREAFLFLCLAVMTPTAFLVGAILKAV
jgi:hypothetical protein